MRTVFIYEFITGGGCYSLGSELPSGSLLAEGMAMRDAVASDFAALPNIEVIHLFHDPRLPLPAIPKQQLHIIEDEKRELIELGELAREGVPTILIAPEFGDELLRRAELFEAFRGQLLSPGSDCIRLCSHKQQTCEHLARHGVPTPQGIPFATLPHDLDKTVFPAVLKPIDGAGSQNVRLINSASELANADLTSEPNWRLERFQPGMPVSVSVLAGPRGVIALQPCAQDLSNDGRFTYQGGSTPLPPAQAARAKRLALATVETLPAPRGYLGIDMVLGSAENGSNDVVIEINPRLTTSYLGLRQACQQNLADAMWRQALGEPIKLSFRTDFIRFAAGEPVTNQPIARSTS